ncbi:hypothetical protein [Noviherbaspirillum aerium]|uniref:hypothetical protein n=1 Tax=Noviherbaspirillum aerium TaxID=2588497 RepID=UPI00124D15B8|nr:hypothetical protein [Noviherbaspirillum aerium]
MSIIVRLLVVLCYAVLFATSAMADSGQEPAIANERAVAFCGGNQECEATMRKREMLAAEKRQQMEAADRALKDSDPASYYLTLLGRFAMAVAFIGGAAGLYVFAMHLLFGKKKRAAKNKTGSDGI